MKQLKFRMWNNVEEDKSMSKMFYDIEQVMECLKQQMYFENSEYKYHELGFNHVGDGSVFMQFTGFTDMNGKEIFNGDIIYNDNEFGCICGHGRFTDRMPWKRIVAWDEKDACFKLNHVDENIRAYSASGYTFCEKNCNESFVVVGNIYENKEILTDEDDMYQLRKMLNQRTKVA